MAKRKMTMTIAQRVKGAKKALKNKKTPAGLRAYLKDFVKKHG